ncbi:MAG: hypothetical protein AAF441_23675 [Pseudomonadota bacterium]
MQSKATKNPSNHFEHTDVVSVIGHSHTSFDDAVASALQQLACPAPGHNHHPHLEFISFNVVNMGGVLEHDREKETCVVVHYSARIDVEARHVHDDDDDHGHDH